MSNVKMKAYNGPSLENGHIEFPSLYLRRLNSGDKKNQHVVIDGFGSTDLGLTSIVDCGIYDGVGEKAKLVARAKGMRMNADHSWCNFFIIVFELDGFKGSTLEVMGATMVKANETTIEEKGEWAIVGGTGEFAMARGLITRKGRQVVDGGEILELSLEAYCRTTKVVTPATTPAAVATPAHTATPSAPKPPATTTPAAVATPAHTATPSAPKPPATTPAAVATPAHTATPSAPKPHATPSAPAVRAHKEYGPKGHPGPANRPNFDPKKSSRLKSVRAYYYYGVNGLKFTYTDKDGQDQDCLIGNTGFGRDTKETKPPLELGPDDWVTKVSGTYGSHNHPAHGVTKAIYSLILETKRGKKLVANGSGTGNNGAPFSIVVDGNETTLGFFGQNNGYGPVSIGIYTVPN